MKESACWLREDFRIGTTNIVRIQLLGTNCLAPLKTHPAQPGNDTSVWMLNQAHLDPSRPKYLSQSGIGGDDGLSRVFSTISNNADCGNKLFPAQQAFAMHENLSSLFAIELIITGIHLTSPRVQHRQNGSPRRTAASNRLQEGNRNDRLLQGLGQSLNSSQPDAQPGK